MYLCLENSVHQTRGCLIIARVMLPIYEARQALLQDAVDDGRHEGYNEVEELRKEKTEVRT